MDEISYIYPGAHFRSRGVKELAEQLLQDRPGGLTKAIFVNSGSEVTDAALKLASQYWHEAVTHDSIDSRELIHSCQVVVAMVSWTQALVAEFPTRFLQHRHQHLVLSLVWVFQTLSNDPTMAGVERRNVIAFTMSVVIAYA